MIDASGFPAAGSRRCSASERTPGICRGRTLLLGTLLMLAATEEQPELVTNTIRD